ncbi:MAG: Mut7-C RNAse domain-containing protein [Armatimonadota bacterium]
MLGFDVLYYSSIDDDVLVCRALREGRVILTRDTDIAFRKDVEACIYITSDRTVEQVRQVISELGLKINVAHLSPRCALCNEPLEEVDKESVRGQVPPYTYSVQQRFRKCSVCGRIYWHGSHVERVLRESAIADEDQRGGTSSA